MQFQIPIQTKNFKGSLRNEYCHLEWKPILGTHFILFNPVALGHSPILWCWLVVNRNVQTVTAKCQPTLCVFNILDVLMHVCMFSHHSFQQIRPLKFGVLFVVLTLLLVVYLKWAKILNADNFVLSSTINVGLVDTVCKNLSPCSGKVIFFYPLLSYGHIVQRAVLDNFKNWTKNCMCS